MQVGISILSIRACSWVRHGTMERARRPGQLHCISCSNVRDIRRGGPASERPAAKGNPGSRGVWDIAPTGNNVRILCEPTNIGTGI